MSVSEVLIIVFGAPTVSLLGGIFFKIGKVEQATGTNTTQIAAIWVAIDKIRDLIK